MIGPGGNVGPGNLKQEIRKDYCSVSLSLSQVADLDIKKKINYGRVKKKSKIAIFFLRNLR